MIVHEQKPIKLVNYCGAVYDNNELASALLWYAREPVCRMKRVFMSGRYPAVSIREEKIHIHRLLMLYWTNGHIPDGYVVHHLDGNKLNASRENLCLVSSSFHSSQHNKGRELSQVHRERLSLANHKRKGIRHKAKKPEITPEQVYKMRSAGLSFNKISKSLGLDWCCVKQRYDDYKRDNPELLEEANKK